MSLLHFSNRSTTPALDFPSASDSQIPEPSGGSVKCNGKGLVGDSTGQTQTGGLNKGE